MKIAGIICEYNPMHNGHIYQIEKTRQAGATHVICAMSGNFVQRGEAAMCDKWTRADIAVHCGADLVVDIPVPWSCDSAENFARAGVSILTSLGVDVLSFGCETDDVSLLRRCANALSDEAVGALVRKEVSAGMTYPRALGLAVSSVCGKDAAAVISEPNSILAIEYIRALTRLDRRCGLLAIKRNDAGHMGATSSSALRSLGNFAEAREQLPAYSFQKTKELMDNGFTVKNDENSTRPILAALRSMDLTTMKRLLGEDNGIAERLFAAVRKENSLDSVLEHAKTKCVTMAKLRRSVVRLFLGIPYELSKQEPPYVRVLAANSRGLQMLKHAGDTIPAVTKHSQIMRLGAAAKTVYDIQCRSSDLYMMLSKNIRACSSEQTSRTLFID